MPWIDYNGDTHPAVTDCFNPEVDALHFICCTSCQRAMPHTWIIIQAMEAAKTLPS